MSVTAPQIDVNATEIISARLYDTPRVQNESLLSSSEIFSHSNSRVVA